MALIANALLLLMLGGLELGRYFFLSEQVRNAVGEVARAVIIDPDAGWTDQKAADLVAKMRVLDAEKVKMRVTVDRQTAPALSTVTVTAEYAQKFVLPYLSELANSINTGVTLRFVASPMPPP